MKNIQLKILHVKLIDNRKLIGNVCHVQFNLKLIVLVKKQMLLQFTNYTSRNV